MKLLKNGLLTVLFAMMVIIPVAGAQEDKIGVYKDGSWYLDWSGNGVYNAGEAYSFGSPGWSSVVGDWNGDGKTEIGVYKDGAWYLDWNGDGAYGSGDKSYSFGLSGWSSVVGDWNGDGKTEIGVYKDGAWYLDWNGDGAYGSGDKSYSFGLSGWSSVVGDWNGDGKTEIGVYKDGSWYLDYNGDGVYNTGDKVYAFGSPGWPSVVGDWNGNGKTEIGVYKDGSWYLDYNGDGVYNTGDKVYAFGSPGWPSVVGDGNGDGKTEIGVYQNGVWYLDYNGNGAWNAGIDKAYNFGATGWTPVVGKWYDLKFSMTNVEWYDTSDDLFPWGRNVCNVVSNWMIGSAGWSQRFYDRDGDVNDLDFGSQNSGYQGLDEAEFHYHFGHGDLLSGETYVDYSNYPTSSLTRGDVYKKWDETNKWVVFDACYVLANLQWGGALKYSHGILGFSTEKTVSTDLPDQFLRNCIDYDYTIGYSWKRATQDIYDPDDTARVIFDTENQLLNDHMSGQGYVAPNENPDDDTVYYDSWSC